MTNGVNRIILFCIVAFFIDIIVSYFSETFKVLNCVSLESCIECIVEIAETCAKLQLPPEYA